MDPAQKDLTDWRDAVEDLALMAKALTVKDSDATTATVQNIKDIRKSERKAWKRYRAHWKESGEG